MDRKFVMDSDAGLDDASALLMAAKAHKVGAVQLIGITTVHGNTSL
jgi:inosine-uridine nucleoside N-ribohydrolase